jgi:acetolactate synthase-1/2/3 large subunit
MQKRIRMEQRSDGMKLSDYVVDSIQKQGVHHIFEMIGGAITHLLDSVHSRDDIECVSMHHEQAAAFAAEGYARTNRTLGVAMATSGPGALNLLTGIGSCYFDSVPCLFITGQVNTYEYKFDRPVRQLGFQETDIVSIVKPIVKFSEMVTDASRIRYSLEKAIYLTRHGRPGPVLLDLPTDIQRKDIVPEELESFYHSEEYRNYEAAVPPCRVEDIQKTITLLKEAKRPLILAGGGIQMSAAEEFRQFADLTGIPVVHSLLGLDALPAVHPSSVGLIGSYGNRYANIVVANCDFLLVLGSRLDTRQTGTKPASFAREAVKVHVDIEAAELNHKVVVDLAVHSDLRSFLSLLSSEINGVKLQDHTSWLSFIHDTKQKYPSGRRAGSSKFIDPNRFMEQLSAVSREGDLIVLDVGQNQMWASQSFQLKKDQRLLNAGGMGAMGFALPAAIGAAKAEPGRRVIVVTGDGGIQVNLQELHTLVAHQLPIQIYVMNNRSLGMVRQFQDMYFNGRNQSTVIGYSCPDLLKVAEAFGIPALSIDSGSLEGSRLEDLVQREGYLLIEVELDPRSDVIPKLVVNHPVEDMSPELPREELENAMLIKLWKGDTP